MSVSRSLAALGGLVVCVAGGLLLSRPSVAQPPAAPPPAANGRYQMAIKPNMQGGIFTTVFVTDTLTGQCWYRDTSSETKAWTDMGTPARQAGR